MALAKIKTEMKGDTSRWGHREEYKAASKKRRRRIDRVLSEVRRDHAELLRRLAQ
jgi:hypothetical protein